MRLQVQKQGLASSRLRLVAALLLLATLFISLLDSESAPVAHADTERLGFVPLATPIRLLDTRPGQQALNIPSTSLVGGVVKSIVGRGFTYNNVNIPTNAKALVGNVTAVNDTGAGAGFLTLYPGGTNIPLAANLVYNAGQVIPNAFTVNLADGDGSFYIFALTSINVVIDITGYYVPVATGANGDYVFVPLSSPLRLLDTRPTVQAVYVPGTPLVAGVAKSIVGAGVSSNGLSIFARAKALVGTVTAVNDTGAGRGYVTMYPGNLSSPPLAANLVYEAGQVISNVFTVGISSSDRTFNIYALTGINIVVDITGYYVDYNDYVNSPGRVSTYVYQGLSRPTRLLDTRPGEGAYYTPNKPLPNAGGVEIVGASQFETIGYQGVAIPGNARILFGNATVVNNTGVGAGFITLYPYGVDKPLTANLTYSGGQVISNAFTVLQNQSSTSTQRLSFVIFALTGVNFVMDVSGYFSFYG